MQDDNIKESSDQDIYRQAGQVRLYTAERNIIHVRSAIIFFNIVLYYFFLDRSKGIPSLTFAVSMIAALYTLYVQIIKPYKKYPVFLAASFTAISDCILITFWLLATGSYYSPFYLLWYISVFAVAFRFSPRTTILSSIFYVLCYLLLIYFSQPDVFKDFFPEIIIRSSYILFAGILGQLITRESLIQTHQKIRLEKLSAEVKEANKKLLFQTTLYENMLRAQSELGEGVMIVRNRKLFYVNDALCDLFGYSRDELLAMNSGIELIDKDKWKVEREIGNVGLKGKHVEGYNESVVQRKNGESVFVGYSTNEFEMDGEKNLFFIVRDITDQKLKDLELGKKTRAIVVQNAELEQFVYIASHDLQEPLRMITGFLTQLETKYQDHLDEKARQYIFFAMDGAVRMRKILADLLEYSRVGRKEFDYEEINLNHVFTDMLPIFRHETEDEGAVIEWENMPVIRGGKTLIQQLFQNLISNALKYKKPNVESRISISYSNTPSHWQFAVTDNGIGINSLFYDKIFIIFQRLHSKDEYSGTGIGLAICKKIVENHKGRIWVESVPGEGSTFYFTISKQLY